MKLFTILKNIIAKAKAYTDMKFGLMSDYVVERGQDGIWYYTKWNSGRLECVGFHASSVTYYTTYNGWYVFHKEVPMPDVALTDPLFNGYMVRVGSGYSIPALAMYGNRSFGVYACSDQNGARTYTVTISFTSTWK